MLNTDRITLSFIRTAYYCTCSAPTAHTLFISLLFILLGRTSLSVLISRAISIAFDTVAHHTSVEAMASSFLHQGSQAYGFTGAFLHSCTLPRAAHILQRRWEVSNPSASGVPQFMDSMRHGSTASSVLAQRCTAAREPSQVVR